MDHGFRVNHTTLYDQLRQSRLQKIASGEWSPGMQVPSESEICREFGLSGGTVRKAMDFLEINKFILRQQGRGTFVMDPAGRELMRRFERFRSDDGDTLRQSLSVLSYAEGEATDIEAENLQLYKGAPVRRLTRLRRYRAKPFMYEEIALPSALFPAVKDVNNPELWVATTARNCGVLLGDAEEKISLAACPERAAPLLGVDAGASVMRIRGVMLTIEGMPARWRDAFCMTTDIYYSVPLTRSF